VNIYLLLDVTVRIDKAVNGGVTEVVDPDPSISLY
jgi:hypothetical protein